MENSSASISNIHQSFQLFEDWNIYQNLLSSFSQSNIIRFVRSSSLDNLCLASFFMSTEDLFGTRLKSLNFTIVAFLLRRINKEKKGGRVFKYFCF